MDKPADPATPFGEVYQRFLDDLAKEGRSSRRSTKLPLRHRAVRALARRQRASRSTLASLSGRSCSPTGSTSRRSPSSRAARIRRRRGGLMSRHTGPLLPAEHQVPGIVADQGRPSRRQPVPGGQPLLQEEGCHASPAADDRIPKIGKPSDVAILLDGLRWRRPEDLRDRAIVWRSTRPASARDDAAQLTIPAIDFETGVALHRGRQGRQGSSSVHQPHRGRPCPAYIERARPALLERMPRRQRACSLPESTRTCRNGPAVPVVPRRRGAKSGSERLGSCRC